jgi:hypothetical protein
LQGFLQMVNHAHHLQGEHTVQFICCLFSPRVYDNYVVEEEVVSIPAGVTTIVSLLHHSSHFVALVVDIKSKDVKIYDGLYSNGKRGGATVWNDHAVYVLKRARLIPLEEQCQFESVPNLSYSNTLACVTNIGTFTLTMGSFVRQNDGHNCGYIAALKIMEIFGVEGASFPPEAIQEGQFRSLVQ